MAVAAAEFKQALQLWASGVSVVTTRSKKFGLQGMTVTAFSSVSVEPPQILICINESADTGAGIAESQCFAVNLLRADQQSVSGQFSGGCSQEERFNGTPWSLAQTGAPILDESLLSLDCRLVQKVRAGSHWIIIGKVIESFRRSGQPLLYYRGAYRELASIE
jgi:flavin reductase (DIM6/NTAB) family NADH-FMN oxidoreductase RutF